jgi:hypothetical protein
MLPENGVVNIDVLKSSYEIIKHFTHEHFSKEIRYFLEQNSENQESGKNKTPFDSFHLNNLVKSAIDFIQKSLPSQIKDFLHGNPIKTEDIAIYLHNFANNLYKRELWIRGQIKLSIFKYLKAKEKFCEECSTATGRAKFFF